MTQLFLLTRVTDADIRLRGWKPGNSMARPMLKVVAVWFGLMVLLGCMAVGMGVLEALFPNTLVDRTGAVIGFLAKFSCAFVTLVCLIALVAIARDSK